MAHRVAELIEAERKARSERTRSKAAADASDLVLRLWANRSHWPRGWPPESAVKVLRALDRDPYRRERGPSGSPWLDALSRFDELHADERRIWVGVALFDLDLDEEVRALEDQTGELDAGEREVLEGLVRQRDRATEELFSGRVPRSPRRRAETARSKLEDLRPAREALVEEVVQAVKKAGGKGGERRKTIRAGPASRAGSGGARKKSALSPRARRRGPSAR